jgi:low affinity Fe/Cu permease
MSGIFRRLAHRATLLAALLVAVLWILTGTLFNYSETWQLVVSIITMSVALLLILLTHNPVER